MEEFKKVLDVFKDYLEADGNVEIITSSVILLFPENHCIILLSK